MSFTSTKNGSPISLASVPVRDIDALRGAVVKTCRNGARPIAWFLRKGEDLLTVVLADDAEGRLWVGSATVPAGRRYESITTDISGFHVFERELFEATGIHPEGHPWLKPLRFPRPDGRGGAPEETFFEVAGAEVHEVAVGPIHSGVVEPGHFRFNCHGETVDHLEVRLGYQHRGAQRLLETDHDAARRKPHLVESIAGDTVVGGAVCYALVLEGLAGFVPSWDEELSRAIALEMERAAVHIGELGALAGEVAYLLGNAVFGATRTMVVDTNLAACGNRFGRGWLRPGGSLARFDRELRALIHKNLTKVLHDLRLMAEAMFASPSVLERFEGIGVLSKEVASDLGLVGLVARASGLARDLRKDHPWGMYAKLPIHPMTMDSGDVYARAYLRYTEARRSLGSALELVERIGEDSGVVRRLAALKPNSLVAGLCEAWRGEIAHVATTDAKGRINRYVVKDPSFNNWQGLVMAMRGNGISDFPLCEKSFNLSHAGFDL